MSRLGVVFALSIAAGACTWVTPASITSTGSIAGALEDDSAISGDGRYIAFTTPAALLSTDSNGLDDVYRFDAFNNTVLLVSTTAGGDGGNAASKQPSISDDGDVIAFASAATDLGPISNGQGQIFVRSIIAGTTQLVSVAPVTSESGNGPSSEPAISADGSEIVFSSLADNFDPADTNEVSDIFTVNLSGITVLRRSVGFGGTLPDGASIEPAINADGSMIAFTSHATNLISADGNGVSDVFSVLIGGSIERVSEGVLGEADNISSQPSIASVSNDLVFTSAASNLVNGDTNGVGDIFLRASGSPIQRVSLQAGQEFTAASSAPSISATGNRVAFLTEGANINQTPGLIAAVADLTANTIRALSMSTLSMAATSATHVSLSDNGDYASFNSIAAIDAADTNGISDVYERFAYIAEIWPWSLAPGRVEVDSVNAVTIKGSDFRVTGAAPIITAGSAPAITFTDVVVVDAETLTATLTIPPGAENKTYQIWVDTQGSGPGSDTGATRRAPGLTVAIQDPPGDLVDMGIAIGLPGADATSAGLLVEDFDDNSFDDLLYIRHTPTPELLVYNDGVGLTLSQIMNIADRHECASADVNSDGLKDIYCSVGANQGTGIGNNNLWIRQSDGSYVDEAAAWGVTDPHGRGRDVVFLHANNDGLPDLFVSNTGPRADEEISANQLFLNNAGTSFTPAPGFGVDGELRSLCAKGVDFDDDGDDDLVVCVDDGVRMYANQAGAGFIDVSETLGFSRIFRDADFADIDGDGDLDIAFSTANSFNIHRLNNGVDDGVVFSQAALNGHSVAFGDINGDGVPDAYFVQRGCRTELEQNLPDMVARSIGATYELALPPDIQRGCGDAVIAFDPDKDGTDGFVVGNGRGRPGPLQYLVLP